MLSGVLTTKTHEIVGTKFQPRAEKKGGEELESWLLRLFSPKLDFRFIEAEIEGQRVVLLEVDRAWTRPIHFMHVAYIRVGSYKKKLKDFPEKERRLWRIFDKTPFEAQVAAPGLKSDDVLRLLDYPSYFDLLGLSLPASPSQIIDALKSEELIRSDEAGRLDVLNLGALLFARDLGEFRGLSRKATRVIQYRGTGRVETIREQTGQKGYASGFAGLIGYINSQLPANELMGAALRRNTPTYPELAVREVVANALIHQDFSINGAGPMVEIFDGRIEVTNPGQPIIRVDRLLDSPPRSRNEALASLLRRVGVCEERGSGVDKVVWQTELYQLPAPLFEVLEGAMRVTLFAHQRLKDMLPEDRIRACYLHACLKYVERKHVTNTTVRERFGIKKQNSAKASRLIREAVDAGAIGPLDPGASRKNMRYLPCWALTPSADATTEHG